MMCYPAISPSAAPHEVDQSTPRYLSFRIANLDIRTLTTKSSISKYIFDHKKHFGLRIDHSEGLNESMQMLLMGERELIASDAVGKKNHVVYAQLSPLGTDRGINIGDGPQKVLRILGLPTSHDNSTDGDPERTGEGTYLYYYPGGRLNGWSYEAWYSFKHKRLDSISIAMQRGNEVAG